MEIRDCTEEDVPWLCEIGKRTYEDLVDGYDEKAAAEWAMICVKSPQVIVVRGEGVAAFAVLGSDPWAPQKIYCEIVHLFGRSVSPMEAFRVVQAIDERRRKAGIDKLYAGSLFADLSPIMRRLGARQLNPYWVIED